MTENNPQDFIYYRTNRAEEEANINSLPPSIFTYNEVRPVLASGVVNVDTSVKKLMRGEKVRTRYGTYWATKKEV